MEITDKKHELYLGIDRLNELISNDPKLLGRIFEKRALIARKELDAEFKAAGISVTYSDPDYPGYLIEEQADGKRHLIEVIPELNYQARIIREIPPRKIV